MMLTQQALVDIIKIKENPKILFAQILDYIEIVKKYPASNSPYRCEWINPIVMNSLILKDDESNDNIPPNIQVGNVHTFNYIKVPKII